MNYNQSMKSLALILALALCLSSVVAVHELPM